MIGVSEWLGSSLHHRFGLVDSFVLSSAALSTADFSASTSI